MRIMRIMQILMRLSSSAWPSLVQTNMGFSVQFHKLSPKSIMYTNHQKKTFVPKIVRSPKNCPALHACWFRVERIHGSWCHVVALVPQHDLSINFKNPPPVSHKFCLFLKMDDIHLNSPTWLFIFYSIVFEKEAGFNVSFRPKQHLCQNGSIAHTCSSHS